MALRAEYRRPLLAIALAALLIRLITLGIVGPRFGIDSQSYVNQGNIILREGPTSFLTFAAEQSPLYSLVYSACVAVAGANAGWAVGVLQALSGAVTGILLALFTARMTRSPSAGLLAAAITAVHVPFVFWGVYVLTDTLLLSLLALDLWLLARLETDRRAVLTGVAASVVALALVLTRRTNLLVSAVLLAVAALLNIRRRTAVAGLLLPVAAVAVLLVWGGLRARTGASLIDRANAYAWQAVYMGLQWSEQGRGTAGVDVHLPSIDDDAERGAFFREQSLEWIRSDPAYFFSQAAIKFKVLWQPYLPEDSTTHKLISAGYLVPFYVLAIIGWISSRSKTRFLWITTAGVATFTLTCLVTFVDYDQRYRLPAELFLIPLAAVGLERVGASLATYSLPRARRALAGRGATAN